MYADHSPARSTKVIRETRTKSVRGFKAYSVSITKQWLREEESGVCVCV